jgi:hypothetical protein
MFANQINHGCHTLSGYHNRCSITCRLAHRRTAVRVETACLATTAHAMLYACTPSGGSGMACATLAGGVTDKQGCTQQRVPARAPAWCVAPRLLRHQSSKGSHVHAAWQAASHNDAAQGRAA